jgi:DNA-binding response OmpR family regulator
VIDRDIHLAKALLVESNATLRSVAAEQLRNVGVSHVTQASRVKDARLAIEREPFDIIICNREFEGSDDSGQDLLDELRRENLLPHSTVFLMVTSEASYAQVMEAAEAALDGILVRPYSAALLSQRLTEARHRKRELGDILLALDRGEPEVALTRALKRYQEKQPYATYCGRLVAELFLRLERPKDAKLVFEKLAQAANAAWAQLGQARACLALGDSPAAKQVIQAVLAAEPDTADAHDLMGRILVEQCDFDGALEAYRQAAAITPGCLLRNQHAGALAFYQGQGTEALKLLERSVGLGVQSKLFDALTLLLIAVLRHDAGDRAGVVSMRDQLLRYRERFPQSRRLGRFVQAAEVLVLLAPAGSDKALVALQSLSAQAGDDDFDLEAANTVLLLWARWPKDGSVQEAHAAIIERLGMRFCTSKAITEVLLASARREALATAVVKRCQARVAALSEQAMELSLKGEFAQAVELLLGNGERTLNAKWLEMAGLIARRNRERWADADAWSQKAALLLSRSCPGANHIAGIQRSGRSPGGLQLRGKEQAAAVSA